jgi:hypothetical protein
MVMQWDLGLKGLGFLVFMSVAFGLIAQTFPGKDNDGLAVAHRLHRLLHGRTVQ